MIRYCKNGCFFILSIILFYLLLGYIFIIISENESERTNKHYFKNTPDLIAIFTGDNGRIPYGINLAKKYHQPNIFITGVYNKNSVESLLRPLQIDNTIDKNLLIIDYFARNTVENCLSTLRYLREKKGFKNIIIVSHDYHVPRIKTILSKIQTNKNTYHFYFSSLKTDYSQWRNLKILYTEVYKFLRTYAFLMIWDNDTNTQS